jgi:membrane protein YdbS with pleckstrin-like domain
METPDVPAPLFSNEELLPEQLPRAESVTYQPLEREYLQVRTLGSFLFFFLLLIGLTILVAANPALRKLWFIGIAASVWTAWLALNQWYIRRSFEMEGYALRQRDLFHREGLFWRTQTVIPFNRVQHCEVAQGPIEKRYGLASLKVFTAGGDSSDLTIRGISLERARRLRAFVMQKAGQDEEE